MVVVVVVVLFLVVVVVVAIAIDDPVLVVVEVGLVLQPQMPFAQFVPLLAFEEEVIAVGSLADDPIESKRAHVILWLEKGAIWVSKPLIRFPDLPPVLLVSGPGVYWFLLAEPVQEAASVCLKEPMQCCRRRRRATAPPP
jgi:hypothetical protein